VLLKIGKLSKSEGEVRATPETVDDLWHLSHVLSPGDMVFASTQRAVEVASDKLRPEKAEKRWVRLGVRLEDVQLHRFSNRLRLLGVIEHGTDVGHHHTINVEPGVEIAILKRWKPDQLERLKDAQRESRRPKVVIVAVEEGDAVVGVLHQFGVEVHTKVVQSSSGKREGGGGREAFFAELVDVLEPFGEEPLFLLVGPGFAKDDFRRWWAARAPQQARRSSVEEVLSSGTSAFTEAARRGALERLVNDSRLTREAKLVEELMERIARDEPATYGPVEVARAVEVGAAETLLVADETLREERDAGKDDVDRLMEAARATGGNVVVLSTEFEPGKRLARLGGVAALLRFRLE